MGLLLCEGTLSPSLCPSCFSEPSVSPTFLDLPHWTMTFLEDKDHAFSFWYWLKSLINSRNFKFDVDEKILGALLNETYTLACHVFIFEWTPAVGGTTSSFLWVLTKDKWQGQLAGQGLASRCCQNGRLEQTLWLNAWDISLILHKPVWDMQQCRIQC